MRIKLFLLSISFLIFSNRVLTQNKIILESKEVLSESTFQIAISLENTNSVSALQFDLSYDNTQFDILDGHELEQLRIDDHQVSFGTPAEGILRVVLFSMSNAAIKENSGTILNLEFKSKTNPGTYNFEILNVRLSSPSAENIDQTSENGQITILGSQIEINTNEINFGNVLLDSYVFRNLIIENKGNQPLEIFSASDIFPFIIEDNFPIIIAPNQIYSLKLTIDTSSKMEVSRELSFLNNDSNSERKNQKITLTTNIYTTNIITIGHVESEKEVPVEIPVNIENIESFNGFQFNLVIPDGLEFISNSIEINSNRIIDHSITVNQKGNKLKFIGYSPSNKNFIGSNGMLFTFKLRSIINSGFFNLELSDGIITNSNLENIFTNFNNGSFRIKTPNLTINPYQINFDSIPITNVSERSFTLSNTGDAVLVIDEAVFDSSNINLDVQFPLTIASKSSKTLNLKYTPDSLGEFLKSVTFKSSSLDEENIVTFKGIVFSPNYLQLESKEVYYGSDNELNILLKNNDKVKAIQFDIELPTGFNLEIDNILTDSRTEGYDIAVSEIEEALKYRIIMYSTTNNLIQKGTQSILKFPVFIESSVISGEYEFNFSNVIIVDENNKDISSLALSSGTVNVVDTTIPVITLLGNTTVDIEVGTTYADSGATATDNYDGNITSSIVIVNNVDSDKIGAYTVTYNVSDSSNNDAIEVTRTVNVETRLSIDENIINNQLDKKLLVYPNPFSDNLRITLSNNNISKVEIYSVLGKKISEIKENFETISTNNLSKGIYLLKIHIEDKIISRLVLKK